MEQPMLFDAPEGRERASLIYEPSKAEVLAALRAAALSRYLETGQPVSANDLRSTLESLGYKGDARILGAVFGKKDWQPAGQTRTDTSRAAEFGATRQAILTYVPRATDDRRDQK